MKIDIYECEGCKKRTDNVYYSPGWIHLESSSAIDISICVELRLNNKREKQYRRSIQDFCSWDCFKNFMEQSQYVAP